MPSGKSIRVFLADGKPSGLLTAEIMNWTGHIACAPRSELGSFLRRTETSRTGIYILYGDDPGSLGGQAVYIGEGDNVSRRIYQHSLSEDQGGKDFWDRVVILTSKDANLTKAHARYLESRFIALASHANRVTLINGTAPQPVRLPEADESDMEYFIEQSKIMLPLLGLDFLRAPVSEPVVATEAHATSRSVSPILEMTVKKFGITATAQEVDGEFIVFKDSQARMSALGAAEFTYRKLRTKLEEDSVIVPDSEGQLMVFSRNYIFASPSAAAAVVAGRSANGREAWRVQGNRTTFGEWETEGLTEAMDKMDNPEG